MRVYLRRGRCECCSRETAVTAQRNTNQLLHQQPPCAPARLPTAHRMRTFLLVCCCVFALQLLPSAFCFPVRRSSRYKAAPVSHTMYFLLLSFSFFLKKTPKPSNLCLKVDAKIGEKRNSLQEFGHLWMRWPLSGSFLISHVARMRGEVLLFCI